MLPARDKPEWERKTEELAYGNFAQHYGDDTETKWKIFQTAVAVLLAIRRINAWPVLKEPTSRYLSNWLRKCGFGVWPWTQLENVFLTDPDVVDDVLYAFARTGNLLPQKVGGSMKHVNYYKITDRGKRWLDEAAKFVVNDSEIIKVNEASYFPENERLLYESIRPVAHPSARRKQQIAEMEEKLIYLSPIATKRTDVVLSILGLCAEKLHEVSEKPNEVQGGGLYRPLVGGNSLSFIVLARDLEGKHSPSSVYTTLDILSNPSLAARNKPHLNLGATKPIITEWKRNTLHITFALDLPSCLVPLKEELTTWESIGKLRPLSQIERKTLETANQLLYDIEARTTELLGIKQDADN